MVGSGLGLLAPVIYMAVSSYFTTKKSRAFSYAMAGTGFGQMIMPQVAGFLLANYGFRGTVLIMGSLALHGVVGASLFQPVKWHMKKKENHFESTDETEPFLGSTESPKTENAVNETQQNSEMNFCEKLARSMDLSLLKDFRFVILNFGLACAYTVSMDFSLILPLFLQVNLFPNLKLIRYHLSYIF